MSFHAYSSLLSILSWVMHAEKNSSSSSSSSSSGSKKNSSWLCITQCEVHLTNQQSPDRKGGMFIETYWNQASSLAQKDPEHQFLQIMYVYVCIYIYIYELHTKQEVMLHCSGWLMEGLRPCGWDVAWKIRYAWLETCTAVLSNYSSKKTARLFCNRLPPSR